MSTRYPLDIHMAKPLFIPPRELANIHNQPTPAGLIYMDELSSLLLACKRACMLLLFFMHMLESAETICTRGKLLSVYQKTKRWYQAKEVSIMQ
jgi:hypothetical protein